VIQQLAIALVAGFIIWLASKTFYQRRLFFVVQNLFDHSTLSDGGTVEIVVANLGRRPEEEVQLELVPGLRYELVAATSPNVAIDESRVIRIARLAPKQQITLLLLAEGNQRFGSSHIAALTSKDVIGKGAKDMAEANASDPFSAIIGFAILCIVAGAIGAGGYLLGAEGAGSQEVITKNPIKTPVKNQEFSLGCAEFSSNGDKTLSDSSLKSLAVQSAEVKRVFRRGDIVGVEVELKNPTGLETEYSVNLKSPAADSSTRLQSEAGSYLYDILLIDKGVSRVAIVENFIPESYKAQVVWMEVRLEVAGYWVNYKRRISFGRDAGLQCQAPSA
jgi:hypothetical protein